MITKQEYDTSQYPGWTKQNEKKRKKEKKEKENRINEKDALVSSSPSVSGSSSSNYSTNYYNRDQVKIATATGMIERTIKVYTLHDDVDKNS
jgi:hypothetical protein